MIYDGKKLYYLAVGREITTKHDADFYCLNCFRSFRTENKLKKHKSICQNHYYCYAEMLKKDNKILKYNHGEKSMNVLFIIYADLESLLEMKTCHNNPRQYRFWSFIVYKLFI